MRDVVMALAVAGAPVAPLAPASAAQDLVESVRRGCAKELDSYCSKVTPGEGRVLACLSAYEDKLSGQCEFALYDAAAQLERAVAALGYLINECHADAEAHCAGVREAEGRILQCLEQHADTISARCNQALSDLGLRKKP